MCLVAPHMIPKNNGLDHKKLPDSVAPDMIATDDMPMMVYSSKYEEKTVMQTVYEACDGTAGGAIIKTKVETGIVLASDSSLYVVLRPASTNSKQSSNLFEAVIEQNQTDPAKQGKKVLIKVYESDELHKFENEVEKLNLLNEIM